MSKPETIKLTKELTFGVNAFLSNQEIQRRFSGQKIEEVLQVKNYHDTLQKFFLVFFKSLKPFMTDAVLKVLVTEQQSDQPVDTIKLRLSLDPLSEEINLTSDPFETKRFTSINQLTDDSDFEVDFLDRTLILPDYDELVGDDEKVLVDLVNRFLKTLGESVTTNQSLSFSVEELN